MTDRRVTVHGRAVAVVEHGDPAGAPVFFFHGTPDSRLGKDFTDGPARERGLRVLCPDRGGIGRSDPVPGRTIAGYAGEVIALADALGIDRFATVGYSAGGPFALACAAGCGPRITGTALMAGAGPIDDRPGAREGLAKSDLEMLDNLDDHPRREAMMLRLQKWASEIVPKTAVAQIAEELTEPDRAFLARRSPKEEMSFFVESLRQGPAGVMEEYRLWAQPWKIDWSAVTTPVEIFQGEADAMVPMHHAEDIASRLPTGVGRLHRLPATGHLSIQDHVGDVLDALVTP
ncbi:pimeloyl-ACP methyl ester carboxylesterase [Actinomycetospora succinea]|uniref:Pimeloyl-ACP methyl ester carboxylesterase n=1 Tax=Actinomycetospora succinea TaxID=663603 RepID=A0A4R6VSM6_9PSEU|nr:alpha/beta hydrolase [Actinomycetospora succinea]TDQ65626.1 pimeloyl-ACP methyl ester carboxylesterase [Actinomycetospora succinea]